MVQKFGKDVQVVVNETRPAEYVQAKTCAVCTTCTKRIENRKSAASMFGLGFAVLSLSRLRVCEVEPFAAPNFKRTCSLAHNFEQVFHWFATVVCKKFELSRLETEFELKSINSSSARFDSSLTRKFEIVEKNKRTFEKV